MKCRPGWVNFSSQLTRRASRVGLQSFGHCSIGKGRRPMPTPPNKAPKDGPPVRGFTTRNRSETTLPSHCVRKKVKKGRGTLQPQKASLSIAGFRVRGGSPSAEPCGGPRWGSRTTCQRPRFVAHFRKKLARAHIASRIDDGMVRAPCRPRKLQGSKGRKGTGVWR